MDTYQVTITDAARDDITSIHGYITHELKNPFGANNTIKKIFTVISKLDVLPERGRAIGKDSLGSVVRILPVNHYVIEFSVDSSKRLVVIRRVVYGRRRNSACNC